MKRAKIPKVKKRGRHRAAAARGRPPVVVPPWSQDVAGPRSYEGRHRGTPQYKGRHRQDDPDRYIRPTPTYVGGRRRTAADDRRGAAHYRSTNR